MTTLTNRLERDLTRHPPTPDMLSGWAARYPTLNQPLDVLVALTGTPRRQISDPVAGPLLTLARGGDRDAARVLLVAIAPHLTRAARRANRNGRQGRAGEDEALEQLVGHLWEAIVTDATRPTVAFTDQLRRTAERHQHNKRDRHRQTSMICRSPERLDREHPDRVDDLVVDRLDTITRVARLAAQVDVRAQRRLVVAVFPELEVHLPRPPAGTRPRRPRLAALPPVIAAADVVVDGGVASGAGRAA